MKTRLICINITLCCLILASSTFAQDIRWKIIPFPQWGCSIQLPPDASRQRVSGRPGADTCEVYASGGLACIVHVTPTASDAVASTAIEQAIQGDIKEASKMGPALRWETTSKQGDLFKGYTGQVRLVKTDAAQSAIIKAIGTERGVQSVGLVPLGDETAPVLRIAVVGGPDKEDVVAAMAKTISSLVTTKAQPIAGAPDSGSKPAPAHAPEPKPAAKPWPALKSGDIELAGTVESVSGDGKTITMLVETITMPDQGPITLTPRRTKKVLLRNKLDAFIKGTRIHLIGRNDGVGKPITADAIDLVPNRPSELKTGPPGPTPLT